MYNIKRIMIGVLLVLCMMFTLTGCAKCISTEHENVEVNVVGEYYRGSYTTPMKVGKTTTMLNHPAVYQITVEYDDVEYTISGSDTYEKYKDKVGQTTMGTLEIRKYDDGSIRHDIVSLE